MFSSSSLVKLIVFEKQKTGKTNKNITHTEEKSTEATICGTILLFNLLFLKESKLFEVPTLLLQSWGVRMF